MDKIYRTAIYLRISKDEEGEKESGSISNQRQMLMNFIESRNDLNFTAEYVDDGYSGYDFDRPQFQKMIDDIKNGEIDCIVVKDFSRLGRNFQKTEDYMQRIFPQLGVRFISVSDCYDNTREQSASERLANPIINLMNEYHVMETSQKVRNVLEHYRRSGKFIGNRTVYGYVIKNKQLEVDPEAAKVVRMVFNLKIDGMNHQAIGEYLNEMGISCPLEYKIENGVKAVSKHFKTGEKALWSSVNVRRILENPIYIGTLIQGKTTSVSYRDRRRFRKDPSELAVFENAHEAIISDTTFLIVQDLLQRDTCCSKNSTKVHIFSGFAYCGNCGKVLYHCKKPKEDTLWICRNKECQCKGRIKEKVLVNAVFETLKKHMEVILNHSEPIIKSEFIQNLNLTNLKLKTLEKQAEQLKKSRDCLLSQKENGIIAETDYTEMYDFYSNKIAKTEFEAEEIFNQKVGLLDCADEIRNQYEKYFNTDELTRAMLVTFIERIEGVNKTKIRVHFRYEDFFNTDGDISGT
ncbi:MAG: recombinase family protein [Oscillospiraceae bacterium]|nr:recombinase family protein [Oscillospiraceae bacterium]